MYSGGLVTDSSINIRTFMPHKHASKIHYYNVTKTLPIARCELELLLENYNSFKLCSVPPADTRAYIIPNHIRQTSARH